MGPRYGGNGVVMSVHCCRMLRSSGRSRDVFAALDGGAWAGHEGSLHSNLGRSHERTYLPTRDDYGVKRNYRSSEYIMDVTFLCVVMWIYVCTRMCWRIVT